MDSCGGTTSVQHFHAYHAWLVITYLFLVSTCVFLCLFEVLKHLNIATSVDVERVFSRGRLILPHVRSRLAVQSTRASLCVGLWSSQGLVKDGDIKAALGPDKINGEEGDLALNWDEIPML